MIFNIPENAKVRLGGLRELREYLREHRPESDSGYPVVQYSIRSKKLQKKDELRAIVRQHILLPGGLVQPIFFGFLDDVIYNVCMGKYE